MLGSNQGRTAGYIDRGSSWFSSVYPGIVPPSRPRILPSTSFPLYFTNHPKIPHYVALANDNVVKSAVNNVKGKVIPVTGRGGP
jgi:hypothetical protein